MNNSQMTIRVGLFFIIGLALIVITFEALHTGRFSRNNGYSLIASFTNVKELKAGDEVRMAGVRVGSVLETRLNGRRAEAILSIDPKVKVGVDAVATVTAAGLLGGNYISITMGAEDSALLNPGDQIKTKNTPGMNEIMGQLGDLGDQLKGVIGELSTSMGAGENGLFSKIDHLVTDNGPKLTETISNLRDITAKINEGNGTIGRLINDPKLHDDLIATIDEIKAAAGNANSLVADAKEVFAQVKSGKGTLGMLLYNDETGNNIRVMASNLREVSDKLNSGQGTLGKLISDDSLFNTAQGSLKKLDRAVDSMADSGPITALGIAANSLF